MRESGAKIAILVVYANNGPYAIGMYNAPFLFFSKRKCSSSHIDCEVYDLRYGRDQWGMNNLRHTHFGGIHTLWLYRPE